MSATPAATLTLTDPGPAKTDGGHVRRRATGSKRVVTTVEMTLGERALLDELAAEDGMSRGSVMREALRVLGEQRGRSINDSLETPHAA